MSGIVEGVVYKGVEYKTLAQVDEDYFNDKLTDSEYDRLFDLVATLVMGLTSNKQHHDHWGDPINNPNEPTIIVIGDK